jgi:ADP-ribose pyrophosphatase
MTGERHVDEGSSGIGPGKISSRRIHTGKVVNLDTDTVRFPNGSVGEMDIVRHSGASAIIPFMTDPHGADPQILLLKQYRYAAEQYLYEIPAGRLDDGEDPAHCAVRELREETGCTAEHIDFLFTMFTTPGFTDERIHLYLASGLKRGKTAHESDEFITVEAVSLSRALGLVEDGTIKDAKTALGILFAARFRARR